MSLERLQAERTVSDNNENNNDDPRQFDRVEEMTGTKIESNIFTTRRLRDYFRHLKYNL